MKAEQKTPASEPGRAMEKYTVLIAEDDRGLNLLISRMLKREGFNTVSVYSGKAVLNVCGKQADFLLLLDFKLPDLTAFDVLEKLESAGRMVPFIIMTGQGDEKTAVKLMKRGALDYFVKDNSFIDLFIQKIFRSIEFLHQKKQMADAEKAVRDSRDRYEFMFEEAPVGYHELDSEGRLVRVNKTELNLLGYELSEMTGQFVWEFVETDQKEQARQCVLDKLKGVNPAEGSFERFYQKKNGSTIPLLIEERIQKDETGQIVGIRSVLLDISVRKAQELLICESLKEKEVLLKEIHHRVKNNLQIICSLLNLQAKHIKGQKVRDVFIQTQDRIRSMALVHEKLYRTSNLAEIDLSDYLQDLTESLFRSYHANPNQITLFTDIQEGTLKLDAAIPCGLIINELVANALKHAFPENRSGEIRIVAGHDEKGYSFEISDNGVGLPAEFSMEGPKTFGLKIVSALIDQLDGSCEVVTGTGTKYIIKFKELVS